MKIYKWISNWGLVYLLAVVLIGSLVWVQSLNLKTSADDILSIGLLVVFGLVLNSWIDHNPCTMTDNELEEDKFGQESERRQPSYNRKEKMN